MADWNPSLYLQFGAERTRPAAELLARIAHHPATLVPLIWAADLATVPLCCAMPGQMPRLSALIILRYHAGRGLPAAAGLPVRRGGYRYLSPRAVPADVIYANASLQWLTDHQRLFPYLVSNLAKNGVLAVQMPVNWQESSHALMRQVAEELGHPVPVGGSRCRMCRSITIC